MPTGLRYIRLFRNINISTETAGVLPAVCSRKRSVPAVDAVFFLTVFAAVDFTLLVGQEEDLIQLLLNGGNAAGIAAADNIFDFLWEMKLPLFYNFVILDDVDCDIVVDKAKNIEIEGLNRAFHF